MHFSIFETYSTGLGCKPGATAHACLLYEAKKKKSGYETWCSASLMPREIFLSWLGAPVDSRCRGHGNRLLFELANAVLLFYLRGREERNPPGALHCSATGFVAPDLTEGCVGGSAERGEKGEERAGGAGGCAVSTALVCKGWRGRTREAEGQPELAPRSPWGQPGGEEAMLGHPRLIRGHQHPLRRVPARCVCGTSPRCRLEKRLTPGRGRGNKSLGKILHAFAYKSQRKSSSQKPKPGLHRGLSVPFAPLAAAPRPWARQCGLGPPGAQDLV